MKRWGIPLIGCLLVTVVGGAGYLGSRSVEAGPTPMAPQTVSVTRGDVQQTVTAPGKLVGVRTVTLSMEVGGILAELPIRPGESVRKGQTLARLKTADLEREVAQAQLTLEQAELALEQAQEPAQAAELRAARARLQQTSQALQAAQAEQTAVKTESDATVKKAQADRDHAFGVYEENYRYYDQGKIPAEWVSPLYDAYTATETQLQIAKSGAEAEQADAENGVLQARSAYLDAQADLRTLEEGTGEAKRRDLELGVEQRRLELEEAQARLAAATLAAPFAGTVLEVNAQPGESVTAGSALLTISDPAAVEVEGSVVEEDLPLVAAGQPAELFFDARPETPVRGEVVRWVAQRTSDDRPLYPVIIVPEEALPAGLVPGMTVDASIIIAERKDVLRLPRSVVRARGDGTAVVRVWADGQITERTVQTGLRGDLYVEILAGLQEGEAVVGQ